MTAAPTLYPPATGSLRVCDGESSSGESMSWDDVLRRYGNLVSATVRSFQLQDADARDAVQTTWLRLVENAHRVRFPDRLGGWLVTTARHECLRIRRQTRPHKELSDTEPDTVADSSMGPEQRVIDAHIARMLWDSVAELPPRRRAVVQELFTEAPRPYAEVAHAVGIPLGGIGPTRARALRQLRDMLDADGLGPDSWE